MKTKISSFILILSSLLIFNLYFPTNHHAQTQITITSLEHHHKTLRLRDSSVLENRVAKSQITYTLDIQTKRLNTSSYTIDNYYNLWDGKKVVKENLKTRSKKWRNEMTESDFQKLLFALDTNVDSIGQGRTWHTSHHYLNIFIDVIQNGDTTTFRKTKPFELNTPWLVNEESQTVVNPNIDKIAFNLLPKKFPRRELLNLERRKK